MRFETRFIILMALTALMAGCAGNRFTAYRKLEGFQTLKPPLPVEDSYRKAVSDPDGKVIYALAWAKQEVHIYREGQHLNSIGGLGFERTNFQRLSDIGVDTDGGLLALDSAQKLLRKFSPEGRAVGEISLSSLRQPELFCQGDDGTLFVYDAGPGEIVCLSPLDYAELYRFGRFELQLPVSLACNRDYLYAYSADRGTTYVFYLLGQFKESVPAQLAFDAFNNPIRLSDVIPAYSSSLPDLMTVNGDTLTLLFHDRIEQRRISYARGSDAAP